MKDTDKIKIAEMVMQGKTLAEIQESYPGADRAAICEACKFAESNMACKPVFFGGDNPNATIGGLPVCIGVLSSEDCDFPVKIVAPPQGKMYFKTEKTTECKHANL